MSTRAGGFALIAVLWILVLVGATGVSVHAGTRAHRRATANALDAARGRWAARAGLAEALARLDRTRGASGGLLEGARADTLVGPLVIDLGPVQTRVFGRDPGARLNPNRAGADRMVRLFVAAGAPAPGRLAEAILARRRQVEEAAPRRVGEPPRDTGAVAFHTLEALRHLPGVDEAGYRAALPYLTVTGDGRVNVNTAPRAVLTTLAGVDLQIAAIIELRRQRQPYRDAYEVLRSIPPRQRSAFESSMPLFADQAAFSVTELELRSEAYTEGRPLRSTLEAVLELSSGSAWQIVRVTESN